ncbi:hypothetical protein BHM03_00056632 [Ensete ventricosum]|nr:hypothetical protein BHM03_00056632 [Ensete ventricosum]
MVSIGYTISGRAPVGSSGKSDTLRHLRCRRVPSRLGMQQRGLSGLNYHRMLRASGREKGLSPSLGRLLSSRDVLTKTFARVVRLQICLRHQALLAPRNIVKLHAVVDESARLGSTHMRKIVCVSREDGECPVGSGGGSLVASVSRVRRWFL